MSKLEDHENSIGGGRLLAMLPSGHQRFNQVNRSGEEEIIHMILGEKSSMVALDG